MDFYNLEIKKASGQPLKMSEFRNKIVLIVNTATKCGLAPQFDELEDLHQNYKDKGLVILGFPSNQFLNQETETNDTMEETCRINHGVTFQLTEKIAVNGKDTHAIFKYLKDALPGTPGKKIKWNFTKFLITPEGLPYKRYAPTTKPGNIEKDIQQLMKNSK